MDLATGIPFIDWLLNLLDAWGYLIVFTITIFENLFVLGSVTPGETMVIAASVVASRGQLMLWAIWFASVFGTMIGSNISYWFGRRAGMGSVRSFAERIATSRVGRVLRIDDGSSLDEVHEHFHTQGARTVFISRFAIGAKNFVPAVAGATKMPVFWFELYTLLGAMVYTSIMCAIGWFLGEELDRALAVAKGVGYAGLFILVLLIVLLVLARRRVKARRARRGSTNRGEAGQEGE